VLLRFLPFDDDALAGVGKVVEAHRAEPALLEFAAERDDVGRRAREFDAVGERANPMRPRAERVPVDEDGEARAARPAGRLRVGARRAVCGAVRGRTIDLDVDARGAAEPAR